MTCQQAQSLITEYVQDQLDMKTLERFLQHVTNCPDCLEELEVYYIVFTGIKRLDEDENIAINYHEEFQKTVEDWTNRIRRKHRLFIIRRVLFVFLILGITSVANYSLGEFKLEERLVYRTNGNSEYQLPILFKDQSVTNLEYDILKNTRIEMEYASNNNYNNYYKNKYHRNGVFKNLIDGARVQLRLPLK